MSTKQLDPAMASYLNALTQLENGSGGKSYSSEPKPQNISLKPNKIYAVLATDDPKYYFTIIIKPNYTNNGFSKINGFSLHKTMPTYGVVPDGMTLVSYASVLYQMRKMNAFDSLEAFPFRGKEMEQ